MGVLERIYLVVLRLLGVPDDENAEAHLAACRDAILGPVEESA